MCNQSTSKRKIRKAFLYRRMPTNKCREKTIKLEKSPFCNSHVITDLGKNDKTTEGEVLGGQDTHIVSKSSPHITT